MNASVPLSLENVTKRYGQTLALKPTSLHVAPGEMLALLGPSGCGKTTTLRIIAGFSMPNTGSVLIGGVDVTELPPNRRGLGMVFQNYSLFPHMTVGQNVAYGLKTRGMPAAERTKKVRAMLDLVRLSNFEDRSIHQMSGGQQQRVALARSLVTDPKVLLLDEPLGALDRNLRESMQFELRAIQRRLGITSIIVTHDQEEALTMSDRIAVMAEGEIVQVGTPIDIYERPQSQFVSEFLGTANIFDGTLAGPAEAGMWNVRLTLPNAPVVKVAGPPSLRGSSAIRVAVRPERLAISPESTQLRANVRGIVFRGSYYAYELDLPGLEKPIYVYSGEKTVAANDGTIGLGWPDEYAIMLSDGGVR
ncbi:ABC transporter ATP-binding protein [Neorhizobium alkalisoli]|uniref:Spermidine/putrescine import ATP-binding protein PotA n=1 Tax=Neorhizobium alkalisoli TaxID=528178 RepID=A0A561Q7S0_9HYPH|nr:ABC transporter ATP-binding protein [Neorhizobium alkalisoli]TWF46436.1 putative spermidine/putrescine transport system ATP-binding protein/spermidine/putrescine transport system ATP-binding protein [Neorhizobium alkalisoli]